MNTFIVSIFRVSILLLAVAVGVNAQAADLEPLALLPGQTLTLDFHELGTMAKEAPAECQVWIPDNYTATERFPLFVWFGGGKGSSHVDAAQGMIDFKEIDIG